MKINLSAGMDEKILHHKFVKLGNNRRRLTNELLALLPEIYEREIYKKYAKTIEEYAGKFGGLSRGVVEKRLRLEKYVKDKPKLRDAIRTEGMHKVALVASLATMENDGLLADKVKNMSKPALQELSKELRSKQEENVVNSGLFENFDTSRNFSANFNQLKVSFCKAVPIKITIELDEEMSFMFLKLKQKFAKQNSLTAENLSNKEAMKIMMEQLLNVNSKKQEIGVEKIPREDGTKASQETGNSGILTDQKVIPGDNFLKIKNAEVNRHISVHLKTKSLQSTAGKCAYPNCNKPAEVFHHTERFAESKNHHSIKPLCKIHHEFMHNGLVINQTNDQSDWQLGLDGELTYADYFYRRYRKT